MNDIPQRGQPLRAIVPGILVPMVFVAAFVLPVHDPKANGLPIAVAGPMTQARPLLTPLGDVKIIHAADAQAARRAVRHRDAYGAIVVASRAAIDVASGASFVVATMLRQDAARAGVPLVHIHDLAPLPAGDPRGSVLNLVVLALLITSITGAALGVLHMPHLTLGKREASVATVALLAASGTAAILKALNALPGPFFAEVALLALTIFTVALITGGLIRHRKPVGTTIAFFLFLVLANPSSGLATAPDLLPTPWKQLGGLMPPGAIGQALHGIAYFGGARILGPVLVVVAWASLAVALNLLADRRASARPIATGAVKSDGGPQIAPSITPAR